MYVSNFNRFGKIYRVMMQAAPEARVNTETLNSVKIRNGAEMAPISNFVKLTRRLRPRPDEPFQHVHLDFGHRYP